MKNTLPPSERTRRAFLRTGLVLPAVWAASRTLAPTPACADPDDPTPSGGAGPFFRPRSPERTSFLDPGLDGTPFELSGRVLTTDGRPVPRAVLDFWHTDRAGRTTTRATASVATSGRTRTGATSCARSCPARTAACRSTIT